MGLTPGWAIVLERVLVSSWALSDVGTFRFKDGDDTGPSGTLTFLVTGFSWVATAFAVPTRDVPEEAWLGF